MLWILAAVEPIAETEGSVLLRGDVLKCMLDMYSQAKQQSSGKTFALKNLNIVDPLLPTNNLGRSVNKASKARIRKALSHGSRLLNAIFKEVLLMTRSKLQMQSDPSIPGGRSTCPSI